MLGPGCAAGPSSELGKGDPQFVGGPQLEEVVLVARDAEYRSKKSGVTAW